MKKENGITLIALVIILIILLIIAGITIGSTQGRKAIITEARSQVLISNLKQVQQAVLETDIKYKQTLNKNVLKGSEISWDQAEDELENINSSLRLRTTRYEGNSNSDPELSYYILDGTNLENLGLRDSEDTYIVNYFSGEVFNITAKKTLDGEELYVYVNE